MPASFANFLGVYPRSAWGTNAASSRPRPSYRRRSTHGPVLLRLDQPQSMPGGSSGCTGKMMAAQESSCSLWMDDLIEIVADAVMPNDYLKLGTKLRIPFRTIEATRVAVISKGTAPFPDSTLSLLHEWQNGQAELDELQQAQKLSQGLFAAGQRRLASFVVREMEKRRKELGEITKKKREKESIRETRPDDLRMPCQESTEADEDADDGEETVEQSVETPSPRDDGVGIGMSGLSLQNQNQPEKEAKCDVIRDEGQQRRTGADGGVGSRQATNVHRRSRTQSDEDRCLSRNPKSPRSNWSPNTKPNQANPFAPLRKNTKKKKNLAIAYSETKAVVDESRPHCDKGVGTTRVDCL